MQVVEVPLTAAPQRLTVGLGGKTYQITLQWREIDGGGWVIDIADSRGASILNGVPLVTGADLLAQYAYLGFGGSLVVQTDNDPDAVPTYENLGTASHVYFVTR